MNDGPRWYGAIGAVVGVALFVGGWWYAVSTYGLFLGIGLGWLPAAVIGLIGGFLWPIAVLGGAAALLQ